MRNTALFIFLMLAVPTMIVAQEGDNQLDIGLQMLEHGEMRIGGLNPTTENETYSQKNAYFLMSRTRLNIDYKRSGLETKVTAQHSGVWGQKGQGSFNIHEAWARLSMKNGLFAQIGRQALSYDDERIIGPNDWAMAALSHDVLKLGYEGHGHKAHAILGFNQNAENIYGGTYYVDGAKPYKSMLVGWYHFDIPKLPIGISAIAMNIGMQAGDKDGIDNDAPHTENQQLLGGYVSYRPKKATIEASYYHQIGKDENGLKIDAWMASVAATVQLNSWLNVAAGYDYLSGDEYFALTPSGQIGMVRHKTIKGFNPIYGSHHKFYGMMDFFYVSTYLFGFTPGLQNLYAGGDFTPIKGLRLKARYHYMSIATNLKDVNKTLGHDVDVEASYQLMKDVRLSAGFSYMTGTETMERLKRANNTGHLKWGWFSLIFSPKIFSTKW